MQDRDEFEWDEHNEDHIAGHDVDPDEAEEAATDSNAIFRRRGKDRFGNPRYLCLGETGKRAYPVLGRRPQARTPVEGR